MRPTSSRSRTTLQPRIMDAGLRVRLTSSEREQLVRHPTTDGDAYDLYLQARFYQRLATEEDYLYSRELLGRALVRDPKFALAYAAIAGNYGMMVTDGLERPTDAWPQVNRYMRQAVALDPDLPDALVMEHGVAFLFDWDWAGAERARQRVLDSPDQSISIHSLCVHWRSSIGRSAGHRRRCALRAAAASSTHAAPIWRSSRRTTCSAAISSMRRSPSTSTPSALNH